MKQFEQERLMQYLVLITNALDILKPHNKLKSYTKFDIQITAIQSIINKIFENKFELKDLEECTKRMLNLGLFKYPELTDEQAQFFQELLTTEYDEDYDDTNEFDESEQWS